MVSGRVETQETGLCRGTGDPKSLCGQRTGWAGSNHLGHHAGPEAGVTLWRMGLRLAWSLGQRMPVGSLRGHPPGLWEEEEGLICDLFQNWTPSRGESRHAVDRSLRSGGGTGQRVREAWVVVEELTRDM